MVRVWVSWEMPEEPKWASCQSSGKKAVVVGRSRRRREREKRRVEHVIEGNMLDMNSV